MKLTYNMRCNGCGHHKTKRLNIDNTTRIRKITIHGVDCSKCGITEHSATLITWDIRE